jgi:prenyltransferase beta subunit
MKSNSLQRLLLQLALLVGVALGSSPLSFGQVVDQSSRSVGLDQAGEYVLSCRKPNGAFGPRDQEYTDAAWNYPAVHSLRLLGVDIQNSDAVLRHGLSYPSGHAGYGHWLTYHQAMTRWLLTDANGQSSSIPNDVKRSGPVTLTHQGFEVRYYGSPFGTGGDDFFKTDGVSAAARFHKANELGYYNLSSLHFLIAAILADGREIANPEPLVEFIRQRQSLNGGFVDVRTSGAKATDSEAHLSHTFHAVSALSLLNAGIPRRDLCVKFVQSCQLRSLDEFPKESPEREIGSGGFRFSPDSTRPGNYADAYYTYCGLQVLGLLGAKPDSSQKCVAWLASLQNHDGGFGDRPGWRSRLYSTYYAVHSLAILSQMPVEKARRSADRRSAMERLVGRPVRRKFLKARSVPSPKEASHIDDSFKISQALFKTPVVEPADLEGLSQRGFNLLAMKTDDFETAKPLLEFLTKKPLPIDVVLCPEAYPHRLKRHGATELHHVGNFTLDPKWNVQQRAVWMKADEAGRQGLSWREYQRRVLKPLQKLGSHCYPEQDYELEFAYSAYDDGVYGRGGYNAVQVGFNWSPRDFVRVFPWRERYVDKLVPVADADSHGDLKKWSSQLDHTRHLYIASGSTCADYLEAARNGRVVCVVYGVEGVPSGVSYYGPPAAVDFVKRRVDEWKWWPTPPVTD